MPCCALALCDANATVRKVAPAANDVKRDLKLVSDFIIKRITILWVGTDQKAIAANRHSYFYDEKRLKETAS